MVSADERMSKLHFSGAESVDDVTLAMSPHIFYDQIRREWKFANRTKSFLTLLVLDLTASTSKAREFENALMEIALVIRHQLRSDEIVSRIGFEKLAILIHGNSLDAQKVKERLENALSEYSSTSESSFPQPPHRESQPENGVLNDVVLEWRWLEGNSFDSVLEWLEAANI